MLHETSSSIQRRSSSGGFRYSLSYAQKHCRHSDYLCIASLSHYLPTLVPCVVGRQYVMFRPLGTSHRDGNKTSEHARSPSDPRSLPWSVHMPARCTLLKCCHFVFLEHITQPTCNITLWNKSIVLLSSSSDRLCNHSSSRYARFLIIRPGLNIRRFGTSWGSGSIATVIRSSGIFWTLRLFLGLLTDALDSVSSRL